MIYSSIYNWNTFDLIIIIELLTILVLNKSHEQKDTTYFYVSGISYRLFYYGRIGIFCNCFVKSYFYASMHDKQTILLYSIFILFHGITYYFLQKPPLSSQFRVNLSRFYHHFPWEIWIGNKMIIFYYLCYLFQRHNQN